MTFEVLPGATKISGERAREFHPGGNFELFAALNRVAMLERWRGIAWPLAVGYFLGCWPVAWVWIGPARVVTIWTLSVFATLLILAMISIALRVASRRAREIADVSNKQFKVIDAQSN